MALAPGTRLGPYEVTAQIGAGGMGEVYRSRDPRLERDVAIKVLRHQFGTNYARTYTIAARTGVVVTGVNNNLAVAEPINANCEDNIWVFDIRAEKTIAVVGHLRARLFVDAFNITNSYASETISRATGLAYQRPAAILAPFTTRVGFRVVW